MIVLIDNYDSFSYNLYQLLGAEEPDIRVLRNDALSVAELAALRPDGIVLSPGPGRPEDAGICQGVARCLTGRVPILGVCLGHQAICQALGGRVTYAAQLMHGKASTARTDDEAREVMAVEHAWAPTFGVQFHPESILTPTGARMARNFMDVCRQFSHQKA